MHKFIQIVLFFTFLTSSFKNAEAVSVLGSEARWKNLGSDTFEITFVVYNRCTSSGAALNLANLPPSLNSDSCANSYSVTLNNAFSYVIDDVTQLCASQQSPCAISGGSGSGTPQLPIGVERHTLKYKVFLGGNYANCCWYKLRWVYCCRASNITTGSADSSFIDEFLLNRCFTGSSPYFNANLLYIKCTGQDVTYNIQAIDQDHDSLSYSLTSPLGGRFASPWSEVYPFTCLGGNNPNPMATPPTGFNLNAVTGDIVFRPMQVQISVIKITVKEWRKVNGIAKVIGVTNRDMQVVIIQNCNNKLPTLSTEPIKYMCAGEEYCFNIYSSDQDNSDTTRFIYSNEFIFPGATFTTSPNYVKNAYATFCWTPDSVSVKANPYYFIAGVADNKCPANGVGFKSYKIYALDKLDYPMEIEKISCSSYNFKANNPYPTNIFRRWEIYKGSTLIDSFLYIDTVRNYQFQDTGKYYIKYTGTNLSCAKTVTDSIIITNIARLNFAHSPDTLICKGNSVTLSATPINGQAPYDYSWYHNGLLVSTAQSFVAAPDKTSLYIVKIVSSDTCRMNQTDTITLSVDNSRLQIHPMRDTLICEGKSITISPAFVSGTTPMQYNWYSNGNLISTNTSLTLIPVASAMYVLQLVSADKCYNILSDTFHIDVDYSKIRVDRLPDTTICAGNTVTLMPVIQQGTSPFYYQWFRASDLAMVSTASTFTISDSTSESYILTIYSSDKCYNVFSDTIQINVDNAELRVQVIRDTIICFGNGIIVKPKIISAKAPLNYDWFFNGNLISNVDTLSATITSSGTYILKITSANLCFNTYSDTFLVQSDNSKLAVKPINDTVVCEGKGIDYTPQLISGTPPILYQWFRNGVLIGNTSNFPITLYPGNYVLQITSNDACYNTLRDSFLINTHPLHLLQISANKTSISKGEKLILRANGKGILLWSGLYIQNQWNDSIEIMPLASATYTVYAHNSLGCLDTATININVNATGLKNYAATHDTFFELLPNPADVKISAYLADSQGKQYTIFNLLGQEVLTGLFEQDKIFINIDMLPQGIFFFKVGDAVQKFIKQ